MKSTFKVAYYLKGNAIKKDGTAPIVSRITINGNISQFSTKLYAKPELWSVDKGKMKGQTLNAKRTNTLLDEIKARIHNIYHELVVYDREVSSEIIKNKFLGISRESETFLSLFDEHNNQMSELVGISCSKSIYQKYCLVRKILAVFIKEKYNLSDIAFHSINYSFITKFEIFLRVEYNYSTNTVAKTMQRFKKIFLIAKNNGKIKKDPFANYTIKTEKTNREYLSDDELKLILSKKFQNKRLEQVRDIFLFSCFTGLAYIDVKNLRKDHIRKSFDGKLWISKEREKTKVQSDILLMDIPFKILEKYETIFKNDHLLPIISNQKMNCYLKEIADLCGIKKNLTFHLARHTFATTITLSKGVPIETVSKMLGHTNIKTTQIYAKVVNSKISEDMSHLEAKLETMNQIINL